MKTLKVLVFGILFLLANGTNAQLENSLLWKISGNGLDKPSYLYGTIHIICPDELKLTDKVMNSLKETKQLVLEIDMDDPSMMQNMQRLSVNEGMKNNSHMLTEAELKTLNAFFTKHYQADMSKLGIMKPFALLSMMFIKALDCPQPGSYEAALMGVAAQNKWEVKGLETLEDQIGVFDRVSPKEQLSWLVKYANDQSEFRTGIADLVDAYKKEDITAILKSMADYPEYKDIEDALLYERNEKWIDHIEKMAANKPTFFAVGAAHLASDRGVIQLLRKQGYEVTAVMN